MLRFPERTKTFSLGELIILTPFDLTEFCQLVAEELSELGSENNLKGGHDGRLDFALSGALIFL
jgi:hypothetical protein